MVRSLVSRTTILSVGLGALSLIGSTAFAADDADKGKMVYNGAGACATCHGPEGKGDGPAGAALTPKPRTFAGGAFAFDTDGDGKKGTQSDIFNVISNGAQKYGGSMMMAARPDLPEPDRQALAKYVLTLTK